MAEAGVKVCKCGVKMKFATVEGTGKKIPLDPSAPVYRKVAVDDDGELTVVRDTDAYVTHFKTCPNASEFSRGRKSN